MRTGDVTALARHALAAGADAARQAVGYATAAAHQASRLYSYREAAALLTGALTVLDSAPQTDPAVRLDLLCHLVSAQAHAGTVATARATRQRAVEAARGLHDPVAMSRALAAFDAPVTWTVRENRQVDSVLVEEIEATLDRLPPDADAARCKLLTTLVFEIEGADDARADEASTQALHLAMAGDDTRLLCLALNARYFVALAPDRHHEIEPLGEQLLAVSLAAGLLDFQMQAYHILYLVALGRNDLAGAEWYVDRAVEHSTTGQLGLTLTILRVFDALRALVTGRFDEAERRYTELSAEIGRSGGANAAAIATLGRFFTRLAAGRTRDSLPELLPFHQVVPSAEVSELLTRALLDAGRPDEARAVWTPQAPILVNYYWLIFMAVRAENAVLLDDRATAASCYEALAPWAGRLAGMSSGSITAGPVDMVLGNIAQLLGRPADATRHYADAAELADRLGGGHWVDQARAALQ
jgi:hypothetical protein